MSSNLISNVFSKLLLELRSIPVIGKVPNDKKYQVVLWPNGNVSYRRLDAAGQPLEFGDDKYDPHVVASQIQGATFADAFGSRGWRGHPYDQKFVDVANSLIDAGTLKVVGPKIEWGFDAGFRTSPNPETTFLVDKVNKNIDVNIGWTGNKSRRQGVLPSGEMDYSGPAYVIPSGDAAFEENVNDFRKLLIHVMQQDPAVTSDFKIVGSEKFRNLTIQDMLQKKNEVATTETGIGPLVMFHGTSTNMWKVIKHKGLVPGHRKSKYIDLVAGYSENNVYLAFSHKNAENYATRQALWDKSEPIVLSVTVPDYTKLWPDEDKLEPVTLSKPYRMQPDVGLPSVGDFSAMYPQMWFRWSAAADRQKFNDEMIALHQEVMNGVKAMVKRSARLGTVAYRGVIPPKFIKPSMQYSLTSYETDERRGGPGDKKYDTIRKKVQQSATRFNERRATVYLNKQEENMRITKANLRKVIKEAIDLVNDDTGEVLTFGQNPDDLSDAAAADIVRRVLNKRLTDLSVRSQPGSESGLTQYNLNDDEFLPVAAEMYRQPTKRAQGKFAKVTQSTDDFGLEQAERDLEDLRGRALDAARDYLADNPDAELSDVAYDLSKSILRSYSSKQIENILYSLGMSGSELRSFVMDSMG
jgi:hypothetical protein